MHKALADTNAYPSLERTRTSTIDGVGRLRDPNLLSTANRAHALESEKYSNSAISADDARVAPFSSDSRISW